MNLETLTKQYKKSFWESAKALNYLTVERQLTIEILEKFGIGYVESGDDNISKFLSGYLTFPVRYKGEIKNIYGRYLGEHDPPHVTLPRVPKDFLYNEEALKKKAVILVESPIDALTLIQNKFNACAAMGTRLKNSLVPKFKDKLVFILFDSDLSGKLSAMKAAQKLVTVTNKVHIVKFPLSFKGKTDANSYFIRTKRAALCLKFLLKNSVAIKRSDFPKDKIFKKINKLEGIDADVVKIGRILFKDSDYVDKGEELWVACPKHSEGMERNRSLQIGGRNNIAWCFGCNKGGNAVFFVSWILGISYEEASSWIKENIGL